MKRLDNLRDRWKPKPDIVKGVNDPVIGARPAASVTVQKPGRKVRVPGTLSVSIDGLLLAAPAASSGPAV